MCLLKFGENSTRLCTSVEFIFDWLANGIPPWAAYCAFMSGCLIAIDKQPGVRLFGVGETSRNFFAKIILNVKIPEATMVCQDNQLCTGLKAGIDGAVNGVQAIWDENSTTEDWGFFIVEANNTFNKTNRVGMICTVRHLWQSGARFVFN